MQKLIDGKGADLSTARWWNGRAWIGPYELDIEKKRFMDGNLGKSTGCALNAIWFDADPRTAKELNWEALTEHFLQNEAPPASMTSTAASLKTRPLISLNILPD